MANIEDRVVGMAFENQKFESGVSKTMGTLERLKAALSFGGSKNGLDDISASAGRVNLNPLTSAVEGLSGKFTALKVAGAAALATIVSKATSAGLSLAKSLTIEPLTSGFKEYETGLNSVQTILANTQASGAGLKDVNKTLDDLNHYADKTIYNFSEMTRNIGTFTAAGVDLETSAKSIKGIANLAALSGSNSEQASTAMYQLSQAISSGKVGLQDWNSVVNAGMGGTVFQRALATTAEKMGTLEKGSVSLSGKMKNVKIAGESFRDSIGGPGPKWLTGEVLTSTLEQLTGDMTDAELKAKGFSDSEIKAIQAQAKTALDAATKVKTFSQLIDTAKEAAGSGWATTWRIIFGDFAQAKTLFTGISNVVNGFIGKNADARNAILKTFADMGGRTNVIESLKNVFQALSSVLKPIGQAFREIFPRTTAKQLFEASEKFREFTEGLKVSGETANNIKRTFAGLFAVFSIAKQVVGGVISVIGDMIGAFASGGGGVLKFTGNLGDFLVALDKSLKEGQGLTKFFDGLGAVLAIPIKLLGALRNAVLGMFDGWDEQDAADLNKSLGGLGDGLGAAGTRMKEFGARVSETLGSLKDKLQPAFDALGEIPKAIGKAFDGASYDDILSGIQTGLLGGLVLVIRKFLKNGIFQGLDGGVLESVAGSFDALTGKLQAMQTNVNADTLRKIAVAIGLLTASMVALSLIDGENLKKGLTAMAVGMGQLLAAMGILVKVSGSAGFLKVPSVAAAMILLAGAVDLLTIAVAALGRLSWGELIKGLGGVGALLVGITAAAGPLAAAGPGLGRAGIGITALAVGLNILALAVKQFGNMDFSTMAKGLGAITAALILLASASVAFPPNMIAIGVGITALAVGLRILASAVRAFASMNLIETAKGLGGIAASMVVIGRAMTAMPPGLAAQGAGLLLVAVALRGIAGAVKSMGKMDFGQMAKGLISLAGAMAILAKGLQAMSGTLAGSAALAVASASLTLLAPALRLLGGQSMGSVAKGLIALGGAMAIFTRSAAAVAPVAGALIPLTVALLGLGAAIGIASAGIGVLATGLSALAVSGPAGIGIMVKAITSLVMLLPQMAAKMGEALVKMLAAIAERAPEFVASMGRIMSAMLQVIINNAPKMAEAFGALIQAALKVIVENSERIVAAGFKLLVDFLSGISSNIGRVTSQVADIIVKFLSALTAKLPELIAAGANVLVKFLSGIANNMAKVVAAVVNVVTAFIKAVGDNLSKIFDAGARFIGKLVEGIGSAITKLVTEGGRAIAKFIEGVGNAAKDIVTAGAKAASRFVNALADEIPKLADDVFKAMIRLMNGLASTIRENDDEVVNAMVNLGSAIVGGLAKGLVGIPSMLLDKLLGPIKSGVDKVKGWLKIKSPSRVFQEIGENMMLGLAGGVDANGNKVVSSILNTGIDAANAMADITTIIPGLVAEKLSTDPVITPVLDMSQVTREAARFGDMSNVVPISMAASYGQAQMISQEKQQADEAVADTSGTNGPSEPPVQFIQNNTSPESLSEAEIYRQTKSQFGQAKRYFEEQRAG